MTTQKPTAKAMEQFANDPMRKAMGQLANDPMRKAMEKLANDPMRKAMEQFASDPMRKAMEQLANGPMRKSMEQFASDPMRKTMEQFANGPMRKAMEKLANDSMRKSMEQFASDPMRKAMEQLANHPVLKAMSTFSVSPAHVLAFAVENNVLDVVLAEIAAIDANDDSISFEQRFEALIKILFSILNEIVEKIEFRARAPYFAGILQILLALYIYNQSSEQLERATKNIHQEFNTLNRNHKSLILDEIQNRKHRIGELSKNRGAIEGTFYEVVRSVPLNVEQKYRGAYTSWLLRGQQVKLTERSGKWIKVIAFDYYLRSSHTGWVLKKYLRRIE